MLNAAERRKHPRVSPRGLTANLTLDSADGSVNLEGEVVDISLTGIKIRLNTPMTMDMEGKIKIKLCLPDSGIPLSISGIIKHHLNPTELGLHYIDKSGLTALDKFMFECFKSVKS
jgi:PilZ domain